MIGKTCKKKSLRMRILYSIATINGVSAVNPDLVQIKWSMSLSFKVLLPPTTLWQWYGKIANSAGTRSRAQNHATQE